MNASQRVFSFDVCRRGILCLAAAGAICFSLPVFSAPAPLKGTEEGQALAQELINLKPAEDSLVKGVLKIRDAKGRRTEIPVSLRVITGARTWRSIYETRALDTNQVVRLTVLRTDGQRPRYELTRPLPEGSQTMPLSHLTGEGANVAFADSDFWLTDLGLEFLYWPTQRLLKKELRSSQSCHVLESVNSNPSQSGYARVVSWIDIDTGGIVFAEAYDQAGHKIKQFKPAEFEKVGDRWQVKEIKITNLKTGSQTRLEFDWRSPAPADNSDSSGSTKPSPAKPAR